MANFSPFSLFFLAIFAVILSHSAEGINPICKNTHHIDLCDRIVKGATNARDATINAIGAATNTSKDNQKKLIPLIEKEAGKLPPPERDALVKSCTVDFQDAIGELISGSVFLGRGDLRAAESFLNSARSSTNHCRNAVSQKVGAIVDLNEKIHLFNEIMDVTLALAHRIKS